MGAAKLRRLSVAGLEYLWKTTSVRERARAGRNTTVLTVYRAGRKLAPLVTTFETWDDPIAGNPLKTGWRLPDAIGKLQPLSLHRPRFIAELIAAARARGWAPESARTVFRVDDGLEMLARLGYSVDALRPR